MDNQLQTAITPQAITPQQAAWISLANGKNSLMKNLSDRATEANILLQELSNPEIKSYKIIEEGLNKYRKIYTDMIEERRSFTKVIDEKIIQAVMVPEKQVDPSKNEKYHELNGKAFSMKKKESELTELTNNKNQEKTNIKIHIENEYSRIVGLYRAFIKDEIQKIYQSNLTAKIADPMPAIEQFKAWIATTQPPRPNGYMPRFLNEQEVREIWMSIPQPDWSKYLNEELRLMDEIFLNYESALANPTNAIEHVTQEIEIAKIEDKEKEEKEIALNTLTSESQAVKIQGPVIKKTLVVAKVNTWDWAQKVIAGFYVNIAGVAEFVRVKDWGNLKVSQMADALGKYATKTGVLANGLQYDEVEK